MRKKLLSVCVTVVMLIAMAIPASASAFTPSAETKPAPSVGAVSGEVDGMTVSPSDIVITAMNGTIADAANQAEFDAAIAVVEGATDIESVVGDTGMTTPKVTLLADIGFSEDIQAAFDADAEASITVTLTSTGIADGVSVKAYAYKDGAWKAISATNNGGGSIALTGHFCPVMLVVDASTDGDVTSPNTNDVMVNQFAIAGIVFAVISVGFLFFTKSKSENN